MPDFFAVVLFLLTVMSGLPIGSHHSAVASELATLTQPELVGRAKALGVNVRNGKSWRAKNDILQDCLTILKNAETHEESGTSPSSHSFDQQISSSQALPGISNQFGRSLSSGSRQIVIDLDSEEESKQTNADQVEKPAKKKETRDKVTRRQQDKARDPIRKQKAAYKEIKHQIDAKNDPIRKKKAAYKEIKHQIDAKNDPIRKKKAAYKEIS
jgi:hypothetical protein